MTNIKRCDLGDWRRYRNMKTGAVIAIHKTDRSKVRALAGFARISFEITRRAAAAQLRMARALA